LLFKGVPIPPLPSETRWNTVNDSLLYFNQHWAILTEICATLLFANDPLRLSLENLTLRRASEEFAKQFKPIAVAIDKSQKDCTTIGDAIHIWLTLQEDFPKEAVKGMVFLKQRLSKVSAEACFLGAYVLHPKYMGKGLSPQQLQSALTFLEKRGCIKADVLKFLEKQQPFTEETFIDVSPNLFWKAGTRFGFPAALCTIALSLTCCIASSAGLERQFSSLRFRAV